MNETDLELLARYCRHQADDAFAELVRRYLGLVHSAALRQVRSTQLAEEVSQSVFLKLASQATRLAPGTVLSAWLYQVTRREAVDVVRREARRRLREQIATDMKAMNATTDDWRDIEPLLDEAMHALDAIDRTAVLLRYFENKSLREVGESLGASENAARKRINRAVERLREFFARHGVTVGASGLVVAISANAVQAAPVGLAATISTVAAFAATTIATATSATKALAMTTIQKTLIATSLVAAVGTGIYEANQAATLRAEIRRLQQQASLTVQTGELTREGDEQDLTALREHNEWRNTAELLRLRAQVERLRRDSQELARLSTGEKSNDPMELAARTLVGRINALKQGFEERPNLSIPELAYLNPNRWASVAHDYKLETDDEFREALCSLRNHAKESFAPELGKALINYIVANDGQLPSDALQLKVYFQSPVDDALLQRYEMLHTGRMSDFPIKELLIAEKAPVDEQYESLYKIGASGILMRESGFAARAAMRRGQRRRLTGLDPSRNRIDRRFPPLIA